MRLRISGVSGRAAPRDMFGLPSRQVHDRTALARATYCWRVPSWFHFRKPPRPPEDPAVSVIEQLFDGASRQQTSLPTKDAKAVAEHALWICACVTGDDAPTWLLYETAAGEFMWHRVPDRTEPLDLVRAPYTAGGHASPAEVLNWLQGDVSDPWGSPGHGNQDPGVLEVLRRRIIAE